MPSGNALAAVYEIRMTSIGGDPNPISRFLDADKRGLLTIGETGSMESRRKQFISAIEKHSNHSEGNLLYHLLRHTPLNKRFPNHRLEYRFYSETDKAAEARLIKIYIRKFGEVPPLNSAIPDRDGNWKPEEDPLTTNRR